jgi:hypothetical protein
MRFNLISTAITTRSYARGSRAHDCANPACIFAASRLDARLLRATDFIRYAVARVRSVYLNLPGVIRRRPRAKIRDMHRRSNFLGVNFFLRTAGCNVQASVFFRRATKRGNGEEELLFAALHVNTLGAIRSEQEEKNKDIERILKDARVSCSCEMSASAITRIF